MGKQVRIQPDLEAESEFWVRGLRHVAGVDEAGRGCWAGPVFAAAVILPLVAVPPAALSGVRDSKQLSARQREAQWALIHEVALAVGVGRAEAAEIDALGIVPATRLAMRRALESLTPAPQALIIDALRLPEIALPQTAFPYADARSLSVAAAGIIAKVSRDRWITTVAEVEFPGYGLAQHKGYGTQQHATALAEIGPCRLHRFTFAPVKRESDREKKREGEKANRRVDE